MGEWQSSGMVCETENIALMNFTKYESLHEENRALLHYSGIVN